VYYIDPHVVRCGVRPVTALAEDVSRAGAPGPEAYSWN
jgi:hypothetical protein